MRGLVLQHRLQVERRELAPRVLEASRVARVRRRLEGPRPAEGGLVVGRRAGARVRGEVPGFRHRRVLGVDPAASDPPSGVGLEVCARHDRVQGRVRDRVVLVVVPRDEPREVRAAVDEALVRVGVRVRARARARARVSVRVRARVRVRVRVRVRLLLTRTCRSSKSLKRTCS